MSKDANTTISRSKEDPIVTASNGQKVARSRMPKRSETEGAGRTNTERRERRAVSG